MENYLNWFYNENGVAYDIYYFMAAVLIAKISILALWMLFKKISLKNNFKSKKRVFYLLISMLEVFFYFICVIGILGNSNNKLLYLVAYIAFLIIICLGLLYLVIFLILLINGIRFMLAANGTKKEALGDVLDDDI